MEYRKEKEFIDLFIHYLYNVTPTSFKFEIGDKSKEDYTIEYTYKKTSLFKKDIHVSFYYISYNGRISLNNNWSTISKSGNIYLKLKLQDFIESRKYTENTKLDKEIEKIKNLNL